MSRLFPHRLFALRAAACLAVLAFLMPGDAFALQDPQVSAQQAQAAEQQARAALEAGRFQDAYVALRPALEADPERPDLWFLLGQIVAGMGQPERALQAYDASITLGPDVPSPWFSRGLVLLSLGQPEEAQTSFEKCLELAPERAAQVALYLGMARLRNDDAAGALSALEAADPAAPNYGEVVRFRTEALRTLGRASDAVQGAAAYLQEHPDYQPVRYEMALSFIDAGFPEDALTAMRLAAIANPPYPDAVMEYAAGLRSTDVPEDRIEAAGLYRHGLDSFPGNGLMRAELASLYVELGMETEAGVEASRILETAPNDAEALLMAGNLLLRTRRPQDALTALERARSLAPDDPLIEEQHGLTLMQLQRFDDALAALDHALELDPELLDSRVAAARAALYLDQPERAIELLGDSGPAIEDNAEALVALGEAYVEAERFEDAVPPLQRAVDLDTTLADPLYLLARAYRGIGRADLAQTALEEFQARQQQQQATPAAEGGAEAHRLELLQTRAAVYVAEARYEEALPVLESAVAEHPDVPELYDLMADAYEGLGDSARAGEMRQRAAELRRAPEAGPQHPTPHSRARARQPSTS